VNDRDEIVGSLVLPDAVSALPRTPSLRYCTPGPNSFAENLSGQHSSILST